MSNFVMWFAFLFLSTWLVYLNFSLRQWFPAFPRDSPAIVASCWVLFVGGGSGNNRISVSNSKGAEVATLVETHKSCYLFPSLRVLWLHCFLVYCGEIGVSGCFWMDFSQCDSCIFRCKLVSLKWGLCSLILKVDYHSFFLLLNSIVAARNISARYHIWYVNFGQDKYKKENRPRNAVQNMFVAILGCTFL